MKKLMMGAACLALLLGSCVKNEESQSVTNIRDAKTEQLKSVAALNNAQAEAAKILAEAEAALKLAEAEAKSAEAAYKLAEAEKIKAEAALIAAKTETEKAEAAKALAEAEKAQAEAEVAKAQAAAKIAKIEKNLEIALVNLEAELIAAKAAYQTAVDGADATEKAKLGLLYTAYSNAITALQAAKTQLVQAQANLISAENGLVGLEEAKAEEIEEQEEIIAEAQKQIAIAKSIIESYKVYFDKSSEELMDEYDELYQNEYLAAFAKATAAQKAYNDADEARLALLYDFIRSGQNTITGKQNTYDKFYNGFYNGTTDLMGVNDFRSILELYFGSLKNMLVESDGKYWYHVNLETEDGTKQWYPLYTNNTKTKKVEGEIKKYGNGMTYNTSYNEYVSTPEVNVENFKKVIALLSENVEEGAESDIEWAQELYDESVEKEAKWSAIYAAAAPYFAAINAMGEADDALDEAKDALDDANDAVTTAENNVASKKAASEAYSKKETGIVAQATAAVEEYTKKETGKVAVAEAALAAAKKAQSELKATATAAEKEAAAEAVANAEAALAQVKKELAAAQEHLSDVKKRAEWAAEDLKKAEAELKAAKEAVPAAEAAVAEAEAAVVAAQNAYDDAKRAYEVACADYGVDPTQYTLTQIKRYYDDAVAELGNAKDRLDYYQNRYTSPANTIEKYNKSLDFICEQVEIMNESMKACNEMLATWVAASFESTVADYEYSEITAKLQALQQLAADTTQNEAYYFDSYEQVIETQEGIIEAAEEKIADYSAIETQEQAVEKMTEDLAVAEANVAVCQIAADTAEAELMAALEAASAE